jgi:hypothetical protein
MVGWPIRTPLLKRDWKIETQRNVIHDDGGGHANTCWLHRKLEENRSAHDKINMKNLVYIETKKLLTQHQ